MKHPRHQTHAERLAYADRLLAFAERMRADGDVYSAEIAEWMAENYGRDGNF